MIVYQKKGNKVSVTKSLSILFGFLDADTSLDNKGLQHLKPDNAVTVNLTVKKSLKTIHTDLKRAGWNMATSNFSAEFNNETERYWTLTKIAGPKKDSAVTMHTTLNRDPSSIPGVPNPNFAAELNSDFEQEHEPYLPAFPEPPALPKGTSWCSTIHSSEPPEQMDSGWEWAFNPPKKK